MLPWPKIRPMLLESVHFWPSFGLLWHVHMTVVCWYLWVFLLCFFNLSLWNCYFSAICDQTWKRNKFDKIIFYMLNALNWNKHGEWFWRSQVTHSCWTHEGLTWNIAILVNIFRSELPSDCSAGVGCCFLLKLEYYSSEMIYSTIFILW